MQKTAAALALAIVAAAGSPVQDLTSERFDSIRTLIRPQPGEAPWEAIPWSFCLLEARKRAAAEGKPLYVWTVGGDPTGAN